MVQMTFGERVKAQREHMGMTLAQVADKVGVSEATMQRYESGVIKNPAQPKIAALARALNVDVNYLMAWDQDDSPATLPYDLLPVRRKRVRLLGNIAAGIPIYADEDMDTAIAVDEDIRCDFALRVVGDSMINARIQDGDIVFIREQPDVEDGEIAAVIIDDSAAIKRAYHIPGGVTLVSENPRYAPMTFTRENSDAVRIIGKVVAFQSYV
jgi:repressor LexA